MMTKQMKTINEWRRGDGYQDEITRAYKFLATGTFESDNPGSSEEELLTPYEKPYRLENWDREDLIMYVGGDRSLYEVH